MIIPIPTDNEPEPTEEEIVIANNHKWVIWYLDCPNWKCDKCGSQIFGRCKSCPYCKSRLHQDTPRPTWYIENTFNSD